MPLSLRLRMAGARRLSLVLWDGATCPRPRGAAPTLCHLSLATPHLFFGMGRPAPHFLNSRFRIRTEWLVRTGRFGLTVDFVSGWLEASPFGLAVTMGRSQDLLRALDSAHANQQAQNEPDRVQKQAAPVYTHGYSN